MQTIIGRHTFHLASLVVLSLSLAACGGGGEGSAPSANATEQPSGSTSPSGSTPQTPTSEAPTSEVPASEVPTGNHAPTISGSPIANITSGQAYNFVPSAADADDDNLQFSISSKPSWATFDAATGRLWGTPATANAGSYEEIEISVTDGKVVATLPQFAIVVDAAAPTLRSVRINWQPPLTNTDGSALTDLKGYRIVYGTQTGVYTSSVPVNGTGLATYTVDNLQSGKRYYFSMVSVNTAGMESDYSQEVMVNLL